MMSKFLITYPVLVALLALTSCGDGDKETAAQGSSSGYYPPAGQQGGYWNWPNQQNVNNNHHEIQRQIQEFRAKLENPNNFPSEHDYGSASFRYNDYEPKGWKFLRISVGGSCAKKADTSFDRSFDGGGAGHQYGANAGEVHEFLKSLSINARNYLVHGSISYIVKGDTMYGISFSHPLSANPVCERSADCEGYAIDATTACF